MLEQSIWRHGCPDLSNLSPVVSDLLEKRSQRISIAKDTQVFGPGKPAENLLLLVSGVVRVRRFSDTGGEIVLYRICSGESCALTMACLLAFSDVAAEGIAETEIEAILVQRHAFDDMMTACKEFRAVVFEAYANRITDLLMAIEERAFNRLDMPAAQDVVH
ncbi:MAG: cyclic nucleotide-binding domain-containing protein [Paracoccaceae bacterium]|nr:cyclic nucleotide-binding domain-containing protein [Paracoccaceae bacterium]